MSQPLLAIRGLRAAYGKIEALKGIDIDISAGEIVALIGANGAGKSTLMMTIFGRPRARSGRISNSMARISPACRRTRSRRLRIAQSPEGRRIFPAHERSGKPADGCGRDRLSANPNGPADWSASSRCSRG